MRKYLELFVAEAQEHVQAAVQSLAALTDPPAAEPLNAIFRNFHSIKGMAASMGFEPIAALGHAGEDLFDRARQGGLAWTEEVSRVALETVDAIESMLAEAPDIEPGQSFSVDPEPIIARIQVIAQKPADPVNTGARAAPEPVTPPENVKAERLRCILCLEAGTELPAARVAIAVRRLEEIGRIEAIDPPLVNLADASFDGTVVIDIATTHPEASVTHIMKELVGFESVLCQSSTNQETSAVEAPPGSLPMSIRIPTDALDRFLDSIAGMITWRGALREDIRAGEPRKMTASLDKLSGAVDALRDQVMRIRLLPFEHIIPRLKRSVRDLERRTGKQVSLTITGSEVAMDRSVLGELIDPINHVLRNAVDHGIALPEERRKHGKPPQGNIRIDVAPQSDQIVVVIEDDGRGMNLENIRRTALSRGYVSEEDLATMSEEQTLLLTTVPGFSTAGTVTQISGRGVGLDVVRTRIEALHGHMKIRSVKGQSTRIEMSIPPTVALIDAFIVRCGAGLIAVPAGAVASVQHVDPSHVRSSLTGDYLPLEGDNNDEVRFMPLVHLDDVLQTGSGRARIVDAQQPILTYGTNGAQAALAVNEILAREEMVVKPLGPPLEHLRRYSGAALLNDGRVALVLDLVNVMENA